MHLHYAADLNWRILDDYGCPELKAEYMDKFCDKTIFTCFALTEQTGGTGADVVFDCAAHPTVAAVLTKLVRVQGTIEIVGSYKKPAEVALLDIEFKELTIVGTRVYVKRDFETAIKLIQAGFPYERLITVYPPEKAKEGFDICLNGGNVIKVMYQFC